MRQGRPSQTASVVALARALAHDGWTTVPGFVDPFARDLLSPGWAFVYRLLSRRIERARPTERDKIIRRLDIVPLRVAAVDAALKSAVASGCRQVVLLGAGFDTRAFRLACLAETTVYEVDHPATQAHKRRKVLPLRSVAKSVVFVAVDFEQGSVPARMSASGFRSSEPTAWVWEGVVMYLTDEAVRRTLGEIARCSPPGSILIVNYHEPHSALDGGEGFLRRVLLPLWGEPQIGQRMPEAMQAEVRAAGFEVVSDTRPSEWARALGAKDPAGPFATVMRLLVARRQ
jgi:methyltransferase (TIGR00027 family)